MHGKGEELFINFKNRNSVQPASKSNNFHYNKNLQKHANELRKNMTKAEASLWKYILKAGKLKGYKFRRQRPVLNYIADFMCTELMLIIETDGISHIVDEVIEKDIKKQKALESAGFKVIRFRIIIFCQIKILIFSFFNII